MRRSLQLAVVILSALLLTGANEGARFDRLGHELMCMCGCRQILLECNHVGCQYSDRMRGELQQALLRGDNDSLIKQSFVQKYGNTVLAAPTTSGFNLVAWIMPFAVLALGFATAIVVIRLWKRRAPAYRGAAAGAGVDEATFAAYRRRVHEETEL